MNRFARRGVAGFVWGLRLAFIVAVPAHAMNEGEVAPSRQTATSAQRAGSADRLDLRLPPSTGRPALKAASTGIEPTPSHPVRTLRLEPRRSFIEQGVEGSREALIACQKGAYPGATLASSAVQVSGGDAQPDHCYRF